MNKLIGVLAIFASFSLSLICKDTNAQQAYPSRDIRIISPYAAGGSSGNQARLLARKLSESWGQTVIVDDRPGGNTIIGTEAVARSAPDGYTILWHSSQHVVNPHLFRTSYDALKDLIPVATFTKTELMLVLHPSVPANNLQQFIALAKAKPGTLNYASAGTGSTPHLAGELFAFMSGVKVLHIPYKGVSQAATDLIGGQVQFAFQTPVASQAFVQSGKLKALAVSGDERLVGLPDVPTFTQAGLEDFDVKFWFGLFVPAGTPKTIVDKLSAEIAKILAMPDVKTYLASQGLEPFILAPHQFSSLLNVDYVKYGKLIKNANIKAD